MFSIEDINIAISYMSLENKKQYLIKMREEVKSKGWPVVAIDEIINKLP